MMILHCLMAQCSYPTLLTNRFIYLANHVSGKSILLLCLLPLSFPFYLSKMLISSTDQIASNESLFTYPSGSSAANYSNSTYAPAFLEDVLASASGAVKSACNNDPSCIFDYAQTGNMAIGLATLSTITQNAMNNIIACKLYHV